MPPLLEPTHEEEEPIIGSASHYITNQNRDQQADQEKRASISKTFEQQNEIEDMPIEHTTSSWPPAGTQELKQQQANVFDYMDVIKFVYLCEVTAEERADFLAQEGKRKALRG